MNKDDVEMGKIWRLYVKREGTLFFAELVNYADEEISSTITEGARGSISAHAIDEHAKHMRVASLAAQCSVPYNDASITSSTIRPRFGVRGENTRAQIIVHDSRVGWLH